MFTGPTERSSRKDADKQCGMSRTCGSKQFLFVSLLLALDYILNKGGILFGLVSSFLYIEKL